MPPDACSRVEALFWAHLSGEYESVRRWAWLYVHLAIGLATALAGYAVAVGAFWLAALLAPFPLYYGYRRYLDARPESVDGDGA